MIFFVDMHQVLSVPCSMPPCVHSGFNIWTTQQLTETYYFDAKSMGTAIKLKIDHTGEYSVNPADIDNPNRRDCQAMSQILNVIVKQAMSETGLL